VIVHDEDTLEEALVMIAQGPVRYSDRYNYITISDPGVLSTRVSAALGTGDVVIVVPVGQEHSMEVHTQALNKIRAQRKRQEARDIRKWVAEHPEIKEAKSDEEIIKMYHKARKEDVQRDSS